jgi:hypothetical protein
MLVWRVAENLAPPGFDPRTFQPVASHYTNCDIPGPRVINIYKKPSVVVANFLSNFVNDNRKGGGVATARPTPYVHLYSSISTDDKVRMCKRAVHFFFYIL